MLEPLVVEFTVRTNPQRAFHLWANRTSMWWPSGHKMAGDDSEIVFEGHPGGRIYELDSDGVEHGWGEVLEWEPPARLRYLWHIFFDRIEATTVEVRFDAAGGDTTVVTIIQTGFERLGDAGPARRERTGDAWAAITAPFIVVCEEGPA